MRNGLGRNLVRAAIASLLVAGTAQAQKIEHIPAASTPVGTALPVHTGGRTTSPDGNPPYTHQWPGLYWQSRFRGPEVTIAFGDPVNILHISIDGKQVDTVTKPGESLVRISGLSEGVHEIRVEKATESQSDAATFKGFYVPQSNNVLPLSLPPAYRIEFIGDSYTVGYGNTAGKRQCTQEEIWATTDNTRAFGPLTAKHYNADYQINAFSGRGMVRNYGGFIADPLPGLYPYALYDGKTLYKDTNWKPQIIVIGLGTNDFTTPLHDGEKWKTREELHADYEATYVKFVQSLRAQNPSAYFILMATDQVDGEIQSEAKKALAAIQATGETRIAFLPMNGLNFGGCDWHPDINDDRKISDELIAFIDAHPGIWQGQ